MRQGNTTLASRSAPALPVKVAPVVEESSAVQEESPKSELQARSTPTQTQTDSGSGWKFGVAVGTVATVALVGTGVVLAARAGARRRNRFIDTDELYNQEQEADDTPQEPLILVKEDGSEL